MNDLARYIASPSVITANERRVKPPYMQISAMMLLLPLSSSIVFTPLLAIFTFAEPNHSSNPFAFTSHTESSCARVLSTHMCHEFGEHLSHVPMKRSILVK